MPSPLTKNPQSTNPLLNRAEIGWEATAVKRVDVTSENLGPGRARTWIVYRTATASFKWHYKDTWSKLSLGGAGLASRVQVDVTPGLKDLVIVTDEWVRRNFIPEFVSRCSHLVNRWHDVEWVPKENLQFEKLKWVIDEGQAIDSDDEGEQPSSEHDSDTEGSSKYLKYTQKPSYRLWNHNLQGKWYGIRASGESQLVEHSWVLENFALAFINYVKRVPDTPRTIPAGDPRRRLVSPEHIRAFPVKYRQQRKPLCVLFSLMSAMHLYGDLYVCSLLGVLKEKMLQHDHQVVGGAGLKCCPRMNLIYETVNQNKAIKWLVRRLPMCALAMRDLTPSTSAAALIAEQITSVHEILLLQPLGADGSSTHAIACVYLDNIPNHPKVRACSKTPILISSAWSLPHKLVACARAGSRITSSTAANRTRFLSQTLV